MKSRRLLAVVVLAIVLLAVGGWVVGVIRPDVFRPSGSS
jgi:hypothetical protein